MSGIEELRAEFVNTLGIQWDIPPDLRTAAEEAIDAVGLANAHSESRRRRTLLALINSKFGFNEEGFRRFLDESASHRVFLNYHDKVEVREAFDTCDKERLRRWIELRQLKDISVFFDPIPADQTIHRLHEQLSNPIVHRSDARACDPSERRESILRSLFGGFVFSCFPERRMHEYLNSDCRQEYWDDFYDHLQCFHPKVLHRRRALAFVVVDETLRNHLGPNFRDALYAFIERTYESLSNHCYLAVLITPFREGLEDGHWRLFSDLVLYAEKHRETALRTGYFRPNKIEAVTKSFISQLDSNRARFDVANEGFFFRDCVVLAESGGKAIQTGHTPYNLLLLFDKNERDESLVPCPICRSNEVRGNSYPAIGIKSWECSQLLCPARSAFDRGYRYSVAALIKRRAIASEEDQIPETHLKRWKLDVVSGADQDQVVEMLLRHFTLHGDVVEFINTRDRGSERLGRRIEYGSIGRLATASRYKEFQDSALFARFVIERNSRTHSAPIELRTDIDGTAVYWGDSFEVLSTFESESFDGAVTSPPYYNAREYSTWPNIYCYLYEMYNVARQVFRVLKPGSYFLFNVFDYFDNENTIVQSAMGKKRMILGAYFINLFRRIGFRIAGNTVWHKGEIEGKRNYNQGNRSPYYQLPLNTWEHILVFQKPGTRPARISFPTVLAERPVLKMVRGKNVLGHSAPFPAALPELLIRQMKPGELVLDPFSGSMTTGRAARRYGVHSVSIDVHRDYCELGIKLLREEEEHRPMPLDFEGNPPKN